MMHLEARPWTKTFARHFSPLAPHKRHPQRKSAKKDPPGGGAGGFLFGVFWFLGNFKPIGKSQAGASKDWGLNRYQLRTRPFQKVLARPLTVFPAAQNNLSLISLSLLLLELSVLLLLFGFPLRFSFLLLTLLFLIFGLLFWLFFLVFFSCFLPFPGVIILCLLLLLLCSCLWTFLFLPSFFVLWHTAWGAGEWTHMHWHTYRYWMHVCRQPRTARREKMTRDVVAWLGEEHQTQSFDPWIVPYRYNTQLPWGHYMKINHIWYKWRRTYP